MAGRITHHRAEESSDDGYQERQPLRKTKRRLATPARPRTARHRQAKLIPSVETYTPDPTVEPEPEPIISDSESDFKDLDAILNCEKAIGAKRPLPSRPRQEDAVAGPSSRSSEGHRRVRSQPDERSTEEASDFNPSEAEQETSESDEPDHPRKRSRFDIAPSSSRADPSSREGSRRQRYNPGEGSSRDTRSMLPARTCVDRGGRNVLRGVRIERGPSRIPTNSQNRGRRVAQRHDPGEGSSWDASRQAPDSVQYLHTLTKTVLRAAPPPGMTTLVDRTKKEVGSNPSSLTRVEPPSPVTTRIATHDSTERRPRDFRTVAVEFRPQTNQDQDPDRNFVLNLVDCRNERNDLDGPSSKGKQKEVDPDKKCHPCFKFRRNCDPAAGGSCAACSRTKSKCIPRKPHIAREEAEGPSTAEVAEFSGSKLWEKCRSCAALEKVCIFNENEDDCQNCKTRGWKCQPQVAPKPKKRKEYQGRFQDVKLKCHFCVKSRAHCDGAKPKCGHCVKWSYRCYPPGTELPKKVPKDEKCKRCRQLKLACHEKLPCPRCVEQGIECGMTAKEEKLQAAFLGD